jgi:penicillin-binding protein 1A
MTTSLMGVLASLVCLARVDSKELRDLNTYRPSVDTLLYDDQGQIFARFGSQHRVIANYEDYPKVLYDAVVSIEDKDFEKHSGFGLLRLLSAAYHNVSSRASRQGGSTLTMQLARNLFLSPERTYTRKIREILLAIQIEKHYTKPQIFTLYANQIYLGSGIYGFATGAEFYFGKQVKNLTLDEAALLAALPKAPNNYSPIRTPERALRRRNLVIDAMLSTGKISIPDAALVKQQPIRLHLREDQSLFAPHFAEEVREYLVRQYGDEEVLNAGLQVYTTLNRQMQRAANNAVAQGLGAYERRHRWQEHLENPRKLNPDAETESVLLEGSLLAIENATGEVKAMVGGRNFNRSKFNRATQALRQVGSSFKPYVYTAAIDRGAMPEDMIMDAPVTFMTASGLYSPHNYDQKYEGRITLRHALAESRNIPALKLAEALGIKNVIDYAHRFGLNRRMPPYLPIALGAVELTLLDQTSAFSAFPNHGLRAIPFYILKVTDRDGHVLEQHYPQVQDAVSERTAEIMNSMLRDVILHGTGIAANKLQGPVAGKTGTTNDFTDAWFIGFSPSITCGVWIGFDNRKSLGNKETGAVAALPVWVDFMTAAIANRNDHRNFRSVATGVVLAKQAVY